jgi:hypothetical protein
MQFSLFSPIYDLDLELGGIVLCAKSKRFYNNSRNAYGSEKIVFHFTMFAQSDTELPEKMICNFPIPQHRWQDCMIISHTTGKKHKLFRKSEKLKQFSLWSVEANFLCKHQSRLHVHEVGRQNFRPECL